MTNRMANPYVGPRTFTSQEGERFFGRDREAQELLSLVISDRLVLFSAPSGAGKSSLLNTRLVPRLKQADFAVLPRGRVSGELPPGVDEVDNIFIFNLLLSLEHSSSNPQRLAWLSLAEFLARLTSVDGTHYYCQEEPVSFSAGNESYEQTPYVLIIDQFEEIFTIHPERWPDREEFFRQLRAAMEKDPLLWVVLVMREDYVGTLEPYSHLLPEALRARFYMQRLGYEAALAAIKKPAELGGRPFAPGVAETLADNLRQIRVHGRSQPQPGQFVEPVQLQIVCYQLWQNLENRPPGEITQADLPLDYIDQILIQFYETALRRVARQTKETEHSLRRWFQQALITEAGTRGVVYRGDEQTGGLDNKAADLLVDQFLLRNEIRAGGMWYELTHDRFIPPILKSNAERHIGRLKRQSGLSTGVAAVMMMMFMAGLLGRVWHDWQWKSYLREKFRR